MSEIPFCDVIPIQWENRPANGSLIAKCHPLSKAARPI